ncbi:MAG: hypothetical protein KDC35_10880 [Acidobacteria bacterium]|nr:hypothetical protein [Acidobacteriota bacterium]
MRSLVLLFLGWTCWAQTPKASEAVIRSWPEMIEVDGQMELGRIAYVFDYVNGVAVERHFGADGELVRQIDRPNLEIGASDAEIEMAQEMVRQDPELARFLATEGRVLDGGFILRESDPAPCGTGSRCIHIVAFDVDATHPVFHAVVDLVSGDVIYRNYTRTRRIQP